jgi:hypothetical protein
MKVCKECNLKFDEKTHNQKYCSGDCCRIATNKRIMEKYYQKKARLKGLERLCGCGSALSRYNSEDTCSVCESKNRKHKRYLAMEAIADVISNSKKV